MSPDRSLVDALARLAPDIADRLGNGPFTGKIVLNCKQDEVKSIGVEHSPRPPRNGRVPLTEREKGASGQ